MHYMLPYRSIIIVHGKGSTTILVGSALLKVTHGGAV